MTRSEDSPLQSQLEWFVRLRWIAALTVATGTWVDRHLEVWDRQPHELLALGAGIAGYNAILWAILRWTRRTRRTRSMLTQLAAIQLTFDLLTLTALVAWTGGARSPLLGAFVFHMVITSLLLRRSMAYAAAGVSAALVLSGLWFTAHLPRELPDVLILVGWAAVLPVTVYLCTNITRKLRLHREQVGHQRQRIQAMTDELRQSNKALMQNEKMAAMGLLAAGVAHEIGNPLASMDGLLQLVMRKPERFDLETIEKLREQIARISKIVRQLTEFSHPGEGLRKRTPVRDILSRAIGMVEFHQRYCEIETSIEQDPSLAGACIDAEPHALEQVLINIILNAVDAMATTEQPRLSIHTWLVRNECMIQVTDNGHGIALEHLDLLFEPFFTTKSVARGTGLGLAISDRLVRRHGGQIKIVSSGTGATFTVCLPVAQPDES